MASTLCLCVERGWGCTFAKKNGKLQGRSVIFDEMCSGMDAFFVSLQTRNEGAFCG